MSIKNWLIISCVCSVLLFILAFITHDIASAYIWLLVVGPPFICLIILYGAILASNIGNKSKTFYDKVIWGKRALIIVTIDWFVFVGLISLMMHLGLYTTQYFSVIPLWLQTITFFGGHFAVLFLISVCVAGGIIALRRDKRLLKKELSEKG